MVRFSFSFRATGFLYTGFEALSYSQNFALICGLHFYAQKNKHSFLNFLVFLLALISIFISILISSRLGAVLAIIISFIFILLRSKKQNILIKKSGISKLLFFSSILTVTIISFFKSGNAKILVLLDKYLEFIGSDSVSVRNIESVNLIIRDQIFLPDSFFGLIFGTGDFVVQYPSERISDLGFIIVLNALGIIGLIITLLPYIYIFKLNIISNKLSKKDINLIFSILFILLISNFKGLYLENIVGLSQIIYILVVSMIFKLNQSSAPVENA